jgi:5S rRNA maturation endonuclease (ribonuclease M5)
MTTTATQTETRRRQSSSPMEQAKYSALAFMASLRMDELLSQLGVKVRRTGRLLAGRCPVHGGNNPGAFNIYPDGHSVRGNWRCNTHHCEKVFRPSLLGFVRGVISHEELGWSGRQADKTVPFQKAVDYLCEFLGTKLKDIKVDLSEVEKRRFVSSVESLNAGAKAAQKGWPRVTVRGRLEIPSRYYMSRGYAADVLDKYDVGLNKSDDPANPMCGRIIVPIFDPDYQTVVGVTGRSIHPRCETCGAHHATGTCPPNPDDARFAKWRNNQGFLKHRHLYNYWFAKKSIRETRAVVVVEGPGDVWRLVEAGIHNVVALFGVSLDDSQQVLLEASGAMDVILLLDKDGAGKKAVEEIKKLLGRSFRVHAPTWESDGKDIGEMPVPDVRAKIVPIIDSLSRKRT